MERLLAKNDYFKHTTRKVLSESDKRQTREGANRSVDHLLRRVRECNIPFNSIEDLGPALVGLRRASVYMGRAVTLVKGSTQPRRLYRHRRRMEVALEAMKIAEETGAEYSLVRELFLYDMKPFISEEP